MARRGTSVLELLVVIAIIVVVIAMLLPAVVKARAAANRISCSNNLHQMGLAILSYSETQKTFPPAGFAWAAYDDRPGTTPTMALPDYVPNCLLWEYIGKSQSMFKCPEGADRTSGSPTYGESYQVSYAYNYQYAGRPVHDVTATYWTPLIWDHDDYPGCVFERPDVHRTTWPADPPQIRDRHWPYSRHGGVINVLYSDGHASSRSPDPAPVGLE